LNYELHLSAQQDAETKEGTLADLMDAYGDMVKKIAFTYVKDLNLAEDIAQDVFVNCYHHLDSFKQHSSYRTWIYRIAVNRSKDVLKSNAFRRILPFSKLTVESKEKSPEVKVIDQSTSSLVTDSLLNLPAKYREILFLFYYEELKLKEISEVIGLNESTIKTRLRRGKLLLKKELERRRFER
jgi:RNA polymerase sigma-70 factor, ECF subfamily